MTVYYTEYIAYQIYYNTYLMFKSVEIKPTVRRLI
jgi:hypothetical protein